MKTKLSLLLLLALAGVSQATTYCSGPVATGSGSGADWNNIKLFGSVSPARGDIWYLADGTYNGFTASVAVSGTNTISILKATPASHGTDTGWNAATMGTGQATITNIVHFTTGYWVLNGQKGGGFGTLPPDTNGANYGIAMTQGGICVQFEAALTNIVLSHIYAPCNTNNVNNPGTGWFAGDLGQALGTIDSVTISYCLLTGWGQAIRIGQLSGTPWNNFLYDHNIQWTMYTDSSYHGNPINALWSPLYNATVRYSLFYLTVGTGGMSQVISANNSTWYNPKIYGNVFDQCYCGRAIISGNGRTNDVIQNALVFNNTFLWNELGRSYPGGGLIGDEFTSVGFNTFKNNLGYQCHVTTGASTNDYNEYVSTWDQTLQAHDVAFTNYSLFTNPTNQTYSLVTNTPAGVALGAEYNTDALGNTRTTWSRGAFEFAGASTNPIISVSPSSANFGTLLTNTTADAVFGVTNSGAGTLTGTASTSVPFIILSGGSYSLTNNQGQNVTVRYSPTTAGTNNGTVTFTGGGGTSAPLIGVATNAPAAQGQTTNSPSTTTNTLTIQNMTVGHAICL